MMRKLLSILLSMLMVLSFMPTSAFAEDEGETYDITADASENGTVKFTVNDEEVTKAAKDVEVTVVAVPEPGYKLTALTMNDQDILSEKKFPMPNAEAVVKATFTSKAYEVTPVTWGYRFANGGTVTVSEPRADEGDKITVTATPYEGWGLADLSCDYTFMIDDIPSIATEEVEMGPGTIKGSFEGTFKALAGDVVVNAKFRRLVNVTGTVTSKADGTSPIAGATVVLTWKEDNETAHTATTGADGSFTIENVVDWYAYDYTVSAPNYYGTSGTVWAGVSSDDAAGTITLNASLAPKTDGTVTFDDPEDVTISYGETATKTASAGENDSRPVLYRSSNPDVATVDEGGNVTTTGVGDAIITAYCEESESYSYTEASYALQVTKAAQTALTWDGVEPAPIPWNKPFTRTASGGTTEEAVKYESSDTDIAEVDASGVVTPVKPGNVTISAYRPGGTLYENTDEISYDLKITKADQELTFSQSSLNYTTGMSFDAPKLTVTQTKNETGAVTYSSDNDEVARVNSETGAVTFTKTPGEVKITAAKAADDYYEAAQASYTINVSEWNLDPQKTYYTLEGTQKDPSSGWYTGSVSLKAASGYELSYSKDGEWKETLSNAIDKDAAGEQTVSFYVRDEVTGAISGVQSVSAKKDAAAPVINGTDNGRTYCAAVTLTITDENLASVTLNGEPATLTQDDKLTVNPTEGEQTVIATDKAGNSTSITVTVNDGHTWGEWVSTGDNTHTRSCKFDAAHTEKADCHGGAATCKDKAVCDDCKTAYGELDPHNHTNLRHFPAKAATCTKKGNVEYWHCSVCGKNFTSEACDTEIANVETEKNAANHSGTAVWTQTATTHEQKWNCCNTIVVASEPHEWENGKCTVCKYVCQHTDTNKDHICDICGKSLSDHNGGTATCTKKAVCDYCGKAYGETDPDNHSGALEWVQTAKTHKQIYNCCQAVNVAEANHTWENGKCTVCKYVCQHTDTNKDHICDICGKSLSDHNGGKATCKDKAVCDYCGKAYGSTAPNNHSGALEWVQTATTHEQKWNCCNTIVVASEPHEWENGKCTVCKYVCQHTDTNKDHICDICGKTISDHTGGTATCTKKAVCDYCGKAYGETDPDNHSGALEWVQTAKTHKQIYNCCQAVNVAEANHTWENGKCTVCKYVCQHTDTNKDHICDICGKTISDHTGGKATCQDKAVCVVCCEEYGDLAPHELTHITAKPATAAEFGNTEYWYCSVCDRYFSDENAENEIDLTDTVISKLAPKIIVGNGAAVNEGERTALSFTSDAAFEDFLRVEVDGKTISESSYTVKSGSTVVTLNADYISTLSVGEHTLGIVFQSGTATAKFTVNKKAAETTGKANKPETNDNTTSPQTGDNSNLALWIALLFASGGAVICTTVVSRKKKYNK